MDRAPPLRTGYLFGPPVRGEARPDSDVDLCRVADGAERQVPAAQQWHWAMEDSGANPRLPWRPSRRFGVRA